MIDKIKSSLQQASSLIAEQASNLNESVKGKGSEIIEDWVSILPKLKTYGLELTSFSVGVSLNPVLEVELEGQHENFPLDRIQEILEENKGSTSITLVFNTIKTTYSLHEKTGSTPNDPLLVKIYVKFSPEIRVFIGQPKII